MMIICLIKNLRRTKHNSKDRKIAFRKLAISLLKQNYLITTKQFANMLKSGIEKLITISKRKETSYVSNLRNIFSNINNMEASYIVMEKGKEFEGRNGGYISMKKVSQHRKGDGAILYALTWSNRK